MGDLAQINNPPPPQELNIPRELWDTLHKIPLSLDYYSAVLNSLETHAQFWDGVVGGGKRVEEGEKGEVEGGKSAEDGECAGI